MDWKQEKKQLRKEMKCCVDQLCPNYCTKADASIRENLWNTREYREAKTIFCYVGTEKEIQTVPILLDALKQGKTVGVPRCSGPGVMEVRQIQGLEDLKLGFYGLMEPELHCPVILPKELDLVVVPCLSCDRKGVRLGYGGGYYDRYLPAVNAPKIVLCREKLVREDLPKEPHDQLMDFVITEDVVIFC